MPEAAGGEPDEAGDGDQGEEDPMGEASWNGEQGKREAGKGYRAGGIGETFAKVRHDSTISNTAPRARPLPQRPKPFSGYEPDGLDARTRAPRFQHSNRRRGKQRPPASSPRGATIEQEETRMKALEKTPPRLLRRREVEARTGLSRSGIYARMAEGTFPATVDLGGRSVAWLENEVDAWVQTRIAARLTRAKARSA